MGLLNITVHGRAFQIACDNGQEVHVQQLAHMVDERARAVSSQVGPVSDAQLLVMVCLLLADQLNEHHSVIEQARAIAADRIAFDKALAAGIETLAQRLDGIAERLENS